MKTENVLVYFEATPDSHHENCDYGICCHRLDQYLRAFGRHGLDDLIARIDTVREKIITEYYPESQRG